MRAQVQRVADAWGLLETTLLTGRTSSIVNPSTQQAGIFASQDIKKRWLDWMKKEHKDRLDKLQKALDDKVDVFRGKPGFTTRLKRWDYNMLLQRANNGKSSVAKCGSVSDPNIMKERVQLLLTEYANMKRIDSELKLD